MVVFMTKRGLIERSTEPNEENLRRVLGTAYELYGNLM